MKIWPDEEPVKSITIVHARGETERCKEDRMTRTIEFTSVYDISVTLGEGSIDYPGDPPYQRDQVCGIEETGTFSLSKITMSAHSGTHIDSPAHFVPDGRTIDRYSVTDFVLPAHVVDIEDQSVIRVAELEGLPVGPGEAVLFRTENSRRGLCRSGAFSDDYVYLSREAAAFCVDRGSRLVGIDYISVDGSSDEDYPAHRLILGSGRLILEGIDLESVPSGKYLLVCLPLRIKGGEASPVRAILLA